MDIDEFEENDDIDSSQVGTPSRGTRRYYDFLKDGNDEIFEILVIFIFLRRAGEIIRCFFFAICHNFRYNLFVDIQSQAGNLRFSDGELEAGYEQLSSDNAAMIADDKITLI
uniref:Uncharacterized protein n=1 Tax=Heterorhabditis bacteriophora TaxID=37862 RepID=A0A1I7WLP2_HETBA